MRRRLPTYDRKLPYNHNKIWTEEDDNQLRATFLNTRKVGGSMINHWSPKELGIIFQRSRGSILHRLNLLGCISKDGCGYWFKDGASYIRYAPLGYNPCRCYVS